MPVTPAAVSHTPATPPAETHQLRPPVTAGPSTPTVTTAHPEEAHPVNHDQIVATNAMGFDLLKRVQASAQSDQNLFLSPASVTLALAMILNGADGATHAAILEALHLSGWNETAANEAMAGLQQELGGDLGVELAIANSLWGREGMPFRPAFLEANRRYYAARIEALDFDDPDASKIINGWVNDQTRGRIEEIVPKQIDPETILFLINAIYFKGDWARPFPEHTTREQPFTLGDGAQVQTLMMSQDGEFLYGETDRYQAVKLPYSGERLSMVVVLPRQGHAVDDLVLSLDAATWSELLLEMYQMDGHVAIPRFRFSFATALNEPLAAMGMEVAFDQGGADFGRLHELPWPTWISQVRHKTFVEVNEKGTEAAAVTAIEVVAESMAPMDRFQLIADRPFYFAIQDDRTGSILFLGVLRDPLQTESWAP
jgi:serine protease inhibitor